MVHSRYSIELIKILLDGKWYTTSALSILVGSYIKPEVAYRRGAGRMATLASSLREGRRQLVSRILNRWQEAGKVEKRKIDNHKEWHIKDMEYFKKILKEGLNGNRS